MADLPNLAMELLNCGYCVPHLDKYCQSHDVPALIVRATRAELSRDEYASHVHQLTERVNRMTSAASSAAASTVTALDRIQELMLVVDAALGWRKALNSADGMAVVETSKALEAQVDAHLARVKARS